MPCCCGCRIGQPDDQQRQGSESATSARLYFPCNCQPIRTAMNGSPALVNQYPGTRKAGLADRSRAARLALELVERADDSPHPRRSIPLPACIRDPEPLSPMTAALGAAQVQPIPGQRNLATDWLMSQSGAIKLPFTIVSPIRATGKPAGTGNGRVQAPPAAAPPALSRVIAGSMKPTRRASNFSATSAASMLIPATTAHAVR